MIKKKYLILIFNCFTGLFAQDKDNAENKVPPVAHTGTFSNNQISYVVGKIYVLPQSDEKTEEEKELTHVFEEIIVESYIDAQNKDESKGISGNFVIYPNPVDSQLYFQSDSPVKKIKIFNTEGRMIYAGSVADNCVDLNFLPKGGYTIMTDLNTTERYPILKN
ncbi:hypothetical protein Q763_13930 [Flavobacterium beibuense F44-8]|uniref:Secretion system C-terminal sorting domain-containing protein n=1 Tax=Flavobacterium beibuense F44-8 TaxID=1406840 RepID=A0A0A2LGN4_9FLAO|nr:T9SS type A sorting domain-containing protein [Flavobacterium beibuense]KGO79332.1 hypothetical protein Q763_13930 [Flavobacterium beibuense F44-8]